jgi:5-methylcytosine-specific restriction enzyme A
MNALVVGAISKCSPTRPHATSDLLTQEDTTGLVSGPIDLGGTGTLSRGYEAGNILGIEYRPGTLPDEEILANDLIRLLLLYRSLIEGRDQVEADDAEDPLDGRPNSGQEGRRRYSWHRRAERSRWLAQEAKRIHGSTWQVEACRKDLTTVYGEVAEGYIEAHHLTPFAQLAGRPTALEPKHDFAVVCPDCHRIVHRRRSEPYSLAEVSAMMSAHLSD